MAKVYYSRFHEISRPHAMLVLAGVLLLAAMGYASTYRMGVWSFGSPSFADEPYYLGVIERVRNGENYYSAANATLAEQGMKRDSTFNWRLPTYAWFFAQFPDENGPIWMLRILALASIIGIVMTCFSTDRGQFIALILLSGGTLAWAFYEPTTYLQSEPWCECFALIAIAAYARGWWSIGVISLTLAMFLRELAVPLGVVAFAISLWSRHWRESIVWVLVFVVWIVAFNLHHQAVARQLVVVQPSASEWFDPTGLKFVITTASMNVFVRPQPNVLKSLIFALAILGLAGWRGPTGIRVALMAVFFVLPFLLVWGGDYWGCVYSATLTIGLVHSWPALRDLMRSMLTTSSLQAGVVRLPQ